jgi:hypothetical protein
MTSPILYISELVLLNQQFKLGSYVKDTYILKVVNLYDIS